MFPFRRFVPKPLRRSHSSTRKARLWSGEPLEERRLLALVSVFANAAFNDTTPDATDIGEVNHVIQSLNAAGHGVVAFGGVTAAAIAAATDNEQALLIPELENGNLVASLNGAARTQLNSYVSQGGSLILFSSSNDNDANLLSLVFGINLTYGANAAGLGPSSSLTSAAVGTLFEGGPTTLSHVNATGRIVTSSLPTGSRAIYTEGANTTVARIPFGLGQIIFLGWDWFNAAPLEGTQDGGWNNVLNRAVDQATALTYQSTTSQDLILRRNGNTYQILDASTSALLAQKRIVETNQILITGADNLNTGLTVDNQFGGSIDHPVTYNAGIGATDRLSVFGDIFTTSDLILNAALDGTLRHDGVPIRYTGVENIDDVTRADTFSMFLTGAGNAAVIENGATVFAETTLRVRSTDGSFSNVQIGRKRDVLLNSVGGADTITVNFTQNTPDLNLFTINTGITDGDVVNVSRLSNVRLDVTNSGGSDSVNIGNAGITSEILGEINVSSPIGLTALRIDASTETTIFNVRVRENDVEGLTSKRVNYNENEISSLTVLSGSGDDDIRVISTAAGKATSIGAGGGNDQLLVDVGLLGAGGTLTTDGQVGADTLTNLGSASFTSVTHNVTGPAAGNFAHDARVSSYVGVETVQDVTIATQYTLLGTPDGDTVNIVGGPTVQGAITTQIAATNGTFGPVNVGRKSGINFNSGAGADTITVNNPGGSTGLTALVIISGATDGDVVNVLATRDGVTTIINNTAGADTVNIGNAGLLTGILGALTIEGASNSTSLNINAGADVTARNVTIANGSVSGLAPVPVNYLADAISSLSVQTGAGADVFNISSTAANRTTNVRSGDGNDAFNINAIGLGANSTNNFFGEGGDDTFTSGFSVDATINVDGGPHAVGDRIRYDFAGLGVVLLANSVAAAGRLPITITNIEFQDLIGLGTDIQSVNVRHSPLGGISKIFTTNNAHNAVIQVQGGATYSLFNLRPNVPIAVDGSFLDDRLEIINVGSVLLDAEIVFKAALNSSFGDSLALSGGGNLVVDEIHSATGPNAGNFDLDGVMTIDYSAIEALTDSMLAFSLVYNTPSNQLDQLSYGDGAAIPEAHRIASGNDAFLAYEFASKVEVVVNTGTGAADGADIVSVATTIDMPLMTEVRFNTGAGDDRLTINAASPLPLIDVNLGNGALDRLIVLTGDAPNELFINASAVTGATTPINYSNTEELEVFGQGGDDVLNVTPSAATRFIIHGDAQAAADALKIDVQANNVTVAEGSVTAAGRRPIDFDGIEAGELFSSTVQIVVLTMLHDAGGGTGNVHTGDTTNSGTLQVQDGPVFKFRDLIPTAILFFQGGAGDDRLNFIHDGQTMLNVFLDYVGGGHVSGDVLAFSGNQPPLANETHQPSGPNAGVLTFGPTFTARYAALENIEDSLPVTQFTWLARNDSADNMFYENGVFQPTAHQIRSGNGAFVTHQLTAKTDIDVRLDSGAADLADILDVLVTQAMPGLATLEFFAGAGPDSAAITITAALPPTVYHAGSGILDFLTVRGTASDDALTVEATKVSGSGTSVTYDNEVDNLRVEAGDGNDTINVLSISATIVTVVAGGAGNDTATVQAPLAAVLTFQDGDGDDRLILVGTNADETFNLGGTTVTGAGATVNYDATLEHLDARGLGGLDEFLVSPNAVTEYFVDGGPPTGVLPGDRLEIDFAGTTGRRLSFAGPGAGAWTFTNRKQVGFVDIEEFNYFDLLAAGADAGATSAPNVLLLDALSLEESVRLLAYEANYKEGVRVALGDLNGDGIPELVTAPGRSRAPEIRAFDVTSGAELPQYRFQAFDAGFIGGVYVAVGDVDGDGRNDIITSVGRGPSEVRVYRNNIIANAGAPFAGAPYRKFSPFGDQFIGGASVAAADFTGDGKAEIVVGSGSGMRATARVYNVSANATTYSPLREFLPFDTAFRGGIFVSAGRISGDGVPDVIATQGPSGDSRVEWFDGLTGASLANFDGYTDASSTAPIRGVGADLDGDGMIERIITSQGPDGRTNLIRRFTTTGTLVDQIVEDETQFLNGFHLASFFANAEVLASQGQALPSTADIVNKLYQQVLGRAPEPDGLQYWVDRINAGESYGTVASGIFESAERLDPIIRQYYRDYLLREAEPAGVEFYREVWRADGGPDNVVANIISSAEFFASAGGTNQLWVTELYRRLLGREPDAAGLEYWTTRLQSGQLSRQQVVFGFTRSDENFRNLVNGWYQQYLGRSPTSAELDLRVNRMRNGASQRGIQIELIDSPEYASTP